jgi:hypothetical protein
VKFQVPQFLETETKLIGPFTLRQFLWLAGGGAVLFLLFLTLNRYVFLIVAIPVGASSAALAFVKINEIPLVNYVLYGIAYFFNPKQYIFKKEDPELGGIGIEKEIVLSDEDKK